MVKITPAFFDSFRRDVPQEAPQEPSVANAVTREKLLTIASLVPPGMILRVSAANRHMGTGVQDAILAASPKMSPIERFYIDGESIRKRLMEGNSLLMVSYDVDVPVILPSPFRNYTIEVRLA